VKDVRFVQRQDLREAEEEGMNAEGSWYRGDHLKLLPQLLPPIFAFKLALVTVVSFFGDRDSVYAFRAPPPLKLIYHP